MMDEREIREMKSKKLGFIEENNKHISRLLSEVDDARNKGKQVGQELLIINRILGDES